MVAEVVLITVIPVTQEILVLLETRERLETLVRAQQAATLEVLAQTATLETLAQMATQMLAVRGVQETREVQETPVPLELQTTLM